MNTRVVKLMGRFGIATPIVGALMIVLSVLNNPGWDYATQTLSQMGAEGFGSVLFNSGLLMTGAVMMAFSGGLFELTKDDMSGMIGSAMQLSVSIIMCVLGIVTINMQPFHDQLATALFILIPCSLIAMSVYHLSNNMKKHGYIAGAAALISIVVWVTGGEVNAVKQLIVFGAMSIWQISLGYWMHTLEVPDEF